MMEKPLLVSAPLIKPIQARQKTETRRLTGLELINQSPDEWELELHATGLDLKYYATFRRFNEDHPPAWISKEIASPYGGPGDTLWVRENWYTHKSRDIQKPRDLPSKEFTKPGYMADGHKPDWAGKTRSAIHLPRWLSRIELINQEIRVERLHDITEASSQAEGANRAWETIEGTFVHPDPNSEKLVGEFGTYKVGFMGLWVHLNGRPSWDNNPWVWVIKFTLKTSN